MESFLELGYFFSISVWVCRGSVNFYLGFRGFLFSILFGGWESLWDVGWVFYCFSLRSRVFVGRGELVERGLIRRRTSGELWFFFGIVSL